LRELSLHILDIAENGVTAGADCIQILVEEARTDDTLKIVIEDNGSGLPPEKRDKLTDPFVTTRTTRRVGLGLPLLAAAAQRCDGDFKVTSEAHKGTRVVATFQFNHIDRAPLGDIASTITTLIIGNSDIDFVYTHTIDEREFNLDTREIKTQMEDLSLSDPLVIHQLTKTIRTSLHRLESDDGELESKEANNGKADN
jgi:anti-sigma regulatory factor (Ser/Thr protein kinase)